MPKLLRSLFVAAAALLCLAAAAQAAAPKAKTQAPGYYRVQLGQIEVTALFDGVIDLDTKLLKNTTPEELDRLLARLFVGNPNMSTAVNAYLVNTGKKLVLIDTGVGAYRGPALGHVMENLRAAGVTPAQVDIVVLTHMHGDHVGGLTDASGKARFPKALVMVAQEEADYWLSQETAGGGPKPPQLFAKFARDMAAPYIASGRWQTFAKGSVIVPGVTAVPAFGHTPGHTAYAIESEGQKLLICGDLVHAHAVQFVRPGVAIMFDADQAQAIATRRAIFKDVAAGGYLLGDMHLPFPGIGHVRADGEDAYGWVPVEFAPLKAPAK